MEEKSQQYLDAYLELHEKSEKLKYNSFSSGYFCGDEDNANTCADLIVKGIKTATCSMKYWYDNRGEKMPTVGHLHVVTTWGGEPVTIVETLSVSECTFSEVNEKFAYAEGEGDRSLKWWRQTHWEFFTTECAEIGIEPTQDMVLILEQFRVVYKK